MTRASARRWTGIILAGLGGLAALAWALIAPALRDYRAARLLAQQCEQLRRIGIGLLIYASEFDGALPPTLVMLAERGDVPAADLVLAKAHTGNRVCDFSYVSGLTTTDAPNLVVACFGGAFREGDSTAALLLEGTVRMLETRPLVDELARSLTVVALRTNRAAAVVPPQ